MNEAVDRFSVHDDAAADPRTDGEVDQVFRGPARTPAEFAERRSVHSVSKPIGTGKAFLKTPTRSVFRQPGFGVEV
jgi:hypothetical protein